VQQRRTYSILERGHGSGRLGLERVGRLVAERCFYERSSRERLVLGQHLRERHDEQR
jgi:hypothetical protein